MVEDQFSPEMADRIIETAELSSGGAYTAVGTYAHREMIELVTRLSIETGVDADELVRAFLVGVPAWATWTPGGTRVALGCTDVGRWWVLELGRMSGTSPESGRSYDLDAAELIDDPAGSADVEVSGDAWELDRWLWGRGRLAALTVSGAGNVLERFRGLVSDATQ
jgi:hypothetical protein